MTNQERIDSIKEDLKLGIKVWGIEISDIRWLVSQAERVEELEKLSNNLNHELFSVRTERDKLKEEVKALAKSVDFLEGQRERMGESHQQTIKDAGQLLKQNQLYKQALEEIKAEETVTTALSNGQVAYTRSGHIARKALKGDSNG